MLTRRASWRPLARRAFVELLLVAACVIGSLHLARAQTAADDSDQRQPVGALLASGQLDNPYPFYLQSPQVTRKDRQQRTHTPAGPQVVAEPAAAPAAAQFESTLSPVAPVKVLATQQQQPPPGCLYDRGHFLGLRQCLERKPYPTVGLPAFKNDDLLLKRSLGDRRGCSFTLSNGLFKNYLVASYSLDSDTQCLDQHKSAQLSVQFSNVTLYYLWQLRCLNYANQLQEDSTLEGRTTVAGELEGERHQRRHQDEWAGVCVGSSQSFGFASLQLTNLEAQVELAVDIYKNWRVTNVSLAMVHPHAAAGKSHPNLQQAMPEQHDHHPAGPAHQSTHIREFTFDTLDGDELNWRYLHLYENWTRNRLHVNFLDQFRRFLWISLQRCLGESGERLPVKLSDMFGSHTYN